MEKIVEEIEKFGNCYLVLRVFGEQLHHQGVDLLLRVVNVVPPEPPVAHSADRHRRLNLSQNTIPINHT